MLMKNIFVSYSSQSNTARFWSKLTRLFRKQNRHGFSLYLHVSRDKWRVARVVLNGFMVVDMAGVNNCNEKMNEEEKRDAGHVMQDKG